MRGSSGSRNTDGRIEITGTYLIDQKVKRKSKLIATLMSNARGCPLLYRCAGANDTPHRSGGAHQWRHAGVEMGDQPTEQDEKY